MHTHIHMCTFTLYRNISKLEDVVCESENERVCGCVSTRYMHTHTHKPICI